LSGVSHRRAALAGDRVDLLLRPPLPAIGALDFFHRSMKEYFDPGG